MAAWLPLLLCCATASADALPPNVPIHDRWSPLWHQPDHSRLSAGDVNAFFFFNGVWHLMTQWEMEVPNTYAPTPSTLPIVGWGHSVSTDLLHFTRIAPALVPGPPSTTMEGCYDGSVSFVHPGGDTSKPRIPMLMADGACGETPDPLPDPKARPNGTACAESFGTQRRPDSGGTLAFPADMSDPNLTVWRKDGPITIEDCGPGGGPSAVWEPEPGLFNVMFRANGSDTEARYETRDPSLKSWALADKTFIKDRIGCGGLWHTLPRSVEGTEGLPRQYTHVYEDANGGRNGNGYTNFVLGVYDMAAQTFSNYTTPRLMDSGPGVMYGAFGDDPVGNRTLHVSWLSDSPNGASRHPPTPAPDPDPEGKGEKPQLYCLNRLTSIREVRYEPRLQQLVELPIAEHAQLRSKQMINATAMVPLDQASSSSSGSSGGSGGGGAAVAATRLGGGEPQADRALDFELDLLLGSGGSGEVGEGGTIYSGEDSGIVLALGAQCEGTSDDSASSSGRGGDGSGGNATTIAEQIGCLEGVVFILNISSSSSSSSSSSAVGGDSIAGVSDGSDGSGGGVPGGVRQVSLEVLLGGEALQPHGSNAPPVIAARILPGERSVPIRLMTDVGSAEVFVGGGRAVASVGVYSNYTAVVAAALQPSSKGAAAAAAGAARLAVLGGWRLAATQ